MDNHNITTAYQESSVAVTSSIGGAALETGTNSVSEYRNSGRAFDLRSQ